MARAEAGHIARYRWDDGTAYTMPERTKRLGGNGLGLGRQNRPRTCWSKSEQKPVIQEQNQNTNMSTFIKRLVVVLFVTSVLALVGVGCNTAHGFGKDLESAGEGIQSGTK
jgi:predicted small secreted protein